MVVMFFKKIILFFILLSLCFGGAYYYDNNSKKVLSVVRDFQLPSKINDPSTKPIARSVESFSYGDYCRRKPKVEIKTIQDEPIYRWKDKDGKVHFSDTKHHSKSVDTINYKNTRKDYFDLSIHQKGAGFSSTLKSDLDTRIRKVYGVMSSLLPRDKLQKVAINLWTFSDNNTYQQFRKANAPTVSAKSLGFHSSATNIAASLKQYSDDQLLNTSVHEAVHVMNYGLFGYTERWLNEGLAEYFERMKVYGQTTEIGYSKEALKDIKKSAKTFSFKALASSDRDSWQGQHRNLLYSYSWAWVYFLMGEQDTRNALAKYLAKSAESPCELLSSAEYFNHHIAGGHYQLQNRFNEWLSESHRNQYF